MKSRFMKAMLMAVATVTTVAAMTATAFAAVTLTHPSDNQVTATTTSTVDRLVLAEFDNYGRMTNLAVGTQSSKTVTNGFTMDQAYKTKIMQFSNFENATALEDHRTLGSKTLFVWEGTDGTIDMASGALDPYGCFTASNVTQGTGITMKNTSNSQPLSTNWFHLPMGSTESDWVVFELQMTFNSYASGQTYADDITLKLNNGDSDNAGSLDICNVNFRTSTSIRIEGAGSNINASLNTPYIIQVAVNVKDRQYTTYVNGSSVESGSISGSWEIAALRIQFPTQNVIFTTNYPHYDVTFDNMYIYDGIKPREVDTSILRQIVIDESKSVFNEEHPGRYDDATYTKQLSGKKAIHATTGVVYNGSKKVMLENLPYVNASGVSMVPKDELASVLGIACGSTSGQETKNGVVYVPITSFLSGQTYDHGVGASDNDNLYILGTSSFSASNIDNFNDALMYYRPSMHEVQEIYKKSDNYGEHPRLIATQDDFDALRAICQKYLNTSGFSGSPHWNANQQYMANDAPMFYIRRVLQNAEARGTATDDTAVPKFEPVNAADSPRMDYQRYFASDIHAFAFAYQMTDDPKYAEYAWDDMSIILSWGDLNLAHKLDVSEAMAGLAIGYDWLYDYWVETERVEYIEQRLHDLGLYTSWNGYTSLSGGMGTEFVFDNNHGVVANNGALMLALALMDVEPEACSWIASQAIKGMELNIDKWDTEMWYEGASYWELTMMHTVKFLDVLDGVLGTDFGMSNLEGLSNAANAELLFHAPRGIYNYGDANRDYFYVPELYWLDNRYGDGSLSHYMGLDISYKFGVNSSQWLNEDYVLGALWYDVEKAWNASADNMDLDYVNTDLDVITARNNWSWENYKFFGAKGGNDPADGHAHLDTGSFVFESNGVRWANELGMGTYDDDYFLSESNTDARWKHMTVRAEAHNTIHDNANTSGVDQKRAYADLTLVKKTNNGVIATVNMQPALSNASAATRGFFFTDNRQSLVIRDEVNVNNTNKIWWNMMIPHGTTIADNGDGTYTLTYTTGEYEEGLTEGDGYRKPHTETLILAYDVQGGSISDAYLEGSSWAPINSTNMLDIGVKNSGQIRFSVTPTNASTDVRITIKLTPGDATVKTPLSNYTGGISTWSNMLN